MYRAYSWNKLFYFILTFNFFNWSRILSLAPPHAQATLPQSPPIPQSLVDSLFDFFMLHTHLYMYVYAETC